MLREAKRLPYSPTDSQFICLLREANICIINVPLGHLNCPLSTPHAFLNKNLIFLSETFPRTVFTFRGVYGKIPIIPFYCFPKSRFFQVS